MSHKLLVGLSLGFILFALVVTPSMAAYIPLPTDGDYGFSRTWSNTDPTEPNPTCPEFGVSLRAEDLSHTEAATPGLVTFRVIIYNADNTSQVFADSSGVLSGNVGLFHTVGYDPARRDSWKVFLCGVPGASTSGNYLIRTYAGGTTSNTISGYGYTTIPTPHYYKNYPTNVVDRYITLSSSEPHRFLDVMMTVAPTIQVASTTQSTPNVDRNFWAQTWANLEKPDYPDGSGKIVSPNIDSIIDTGLQISDGSVKSPGTTYAGVNKAPGSNVITFQPGSPYYDYNTRGQLLYGSAWPFPKAGTYSYQLIANDMTHNGDPDHGPVGTGDPVDGAVNLAVNLSAPTVICWVNGVYRGTNSCGASITTSDTVAFTGYVQNNNPIFSGSGVKAPASFSRYVLSGVYDITNALTPEIMPGAAQPAQPTAAQSLAAGDYTLTFYPTSSVILSGWSPSAAIPIKVVTGAPGAPGSPTFSPNPVPCNSAAVTLSWSAPAGALGGGGTTYTVKVTDTTTGTMTPYTTTALSQPITITPGHSYTWTIQASNGPGLDGPLVSGPGFTDSKCKSFVVTSQPVLQIAPGSSYPDTVTVSPDAGSGSWSGTEQITVSEVGVSTDVTSACTSSIPGITLPNKLITINSGAAVTVSAAATTPNNTYYVCIKGTYTSASPAYTYSKTTTFKVVVNYPAWMQVGTTGGSAFAGDVHSNGTISIQTPGGAGKSFFADGVAGVVTADGNSGPSPVDQAFSSGVNNWLIPSNYRPNPGIPSPSFDSLLKALADNNHSLDVHHPDDKLSGNLCPSATKEMLQAGVLSTTSEVVLDSGTGLSACKVVVIGSSSHAANLRIDGDFFPPASPASLIFIVHGNITLSSSVTSLAGAYIWTGSFDDGGGQNQLTINGSLMGLSPSGSFALSRDLLDNSQPAVKVIFQPDLLEVLRPLVGSPSYTWTENN